MATQSRISRKPTVFVMLVLLTTLPGRLAAGITTSGSINVSPTWPWEDPWNIPGGTEVQIGITADGQVTVTLGSVVNSADTVSVGYAPGWTGTMTLTGAGSTWNGSGEMRVGPQGTGVVTVSDGGALISGQGQVGGQLVWNELGGVDSATSGTGSVTVTGSGSHWDNGWLLTGVSGSGTLTVAEGAAVTTSGESDSSALIGVMPDGTGTVAVDGAGSSWSVDSALVVGTWGEGSLTVSNGAQVNSGTGSVGGMDVAALNLNPGDYLLTLGAANGSGTAAVTGPGSQWNVGQRLVVGAWGEGDLAVENGGQVSASEVYIGGQPITLGEGQEFSRDLLPDGLGTVTVNNSTFYTNGGMLFVGYSGTGVLDVNEGGYVGTGGLVAGGAPDGVGTVTVAGGSTLSMDDEMEIGVWGTGQLNVLNGSNVYANSLKIGGIDPSGTGLPPEMLADFGAALGTGTVTVSGGSYLEAGDTIYVGNYGQGTFDVNDAGWVAAGEMAVGVAPGSHGTVAVNGPESYLELYGDMGGYSPGTLIVGGYGRGEMTVSGGGQVWLDNNLYVGGYRAEELDFDTESIGHDPNGSGTVTVTGENSSLYTSTVFVGYSGTGALDVNDGGYVETWSLAAGGAPNSVGTVTVAGGSTLSVGNETQIGAWGTGHLNVLNGGSVYTNRLAIGGLDVSGVGDLPEEVLAEWGPAVGTGAVVVSGEGSYLEVGDTVYVGHYGQGTLDVNDGGYVAAGEMAVGVAPGSHGMVTVDGPESYLEIPSYMGGYSPGTLIVGGYGQGEVTVSGGGRLYVDNTLSIGGFRPWELDFDTESIGHDPNGSGTVTVTGAGSSLEAYTLAVGASGNGTLQVLDGATATSGSALIGIDPGTQGEVLVDNAADGWTNYGSVAVGGYGDGIVTVRNGGRVTVGEMLYIGGFDAGALGFDTGAYGYDPNGTGKVTVSGAGSVLQVLPSGGPFTTYVGYSGDGTLEILDGGRSETDVAVVGALEGSHGLVTVDGAGSTWAITGGGGPHEGLSADGNGEVRISNGGHVDVNGLDAMLLVGDQVQVGTEGQGTMSVANGGYVAADSLVIGGTDPGFESIGEYLDHVAQLGTGTGTVVVDGAAALLDVTGDVFVGFSGNGTLNVTDGQVMSRSGWLGAMPNGTGTATISGATAQWTNQESLTVGMWGQGTLDIENGAHVTAPQVSIGGMPFSFIQEPFNPDLIANGTGTVNVTGSGSALDVAGTGPLYVGYSGAGTLNVASGGTVTTDVALLGVRPGATGTVTVQGKDPAPEGVASSLSVADQIIVGAWGTGNLTVSEGGQVTTNTLYIGGFDADRVSLDPEVSAGLGNPDGTGHVTITGAGSSLSVIGAQTLVVGAGGTGTLTVADQGVATSENSFIGGYIQFNQDPETQVQTATLFGGTGEAHVTDGGQWHTNALVAGVDGTGTLEIASGGQVDSHLAAVGFGPNSHGTATITGPDSTWISAAGNPESDAGNGQLMVGGWGQGQMTVADGGRVDTTKLYIGGFDLADLGVMTWNLGDPTGTGAVTVTGGQSQTASQLNVTDGGPLYVGYTGVGTLQVAAGGQVTSGNSFIGYLANGTGAVAVSGAGSQWQAGNLAVGSSGTGTLDVSAGGHLSSNSGSIGDAQGSMGTATVNGTDSQWQTGDLVIGSSGAGTLRIESGGRVDSKFARVGLTEGATGNVVVDGADSLWRISNNEALPGGMDTAGHGAVTVSNGGQIQIDGSTAVLSLGGDVTVGPTGQGTVSIANGGSVLSESAVIGGATNPAYQTAEQYMAHLAELGTGTGTVALTDQAKWYADKNMLVGFSGNGTLNVTDSVITDQAAWLAFLPNVTGTATISGGMSEWNNQTTLTVGAWGAGTLHIENGAYVSAQEASIGGMPFQFLDESFNPNLIANGTGTVNVAGAGSRLDIMGANTLYVGYSGAGTLDVRDQGQTHAESLLVGGTPGAVGTVTVDGAGSRLSVDNDATVGAWGEGHLTVSNGAQVQTGGLYLGGLTAGQAGSFEQAVRDTFGEPGGTGSVTVTGANSALEVSGAGPLVVGAGGTGTLRIEDHGAVTSKDSFIGGYMGVHQDEATQTQTVQLFSGTGAAHVTGGGAWHTTGLIVGVDGGGTLEVAGGGQVDSYLGGAGLGPHSTGDVTVTGPGSAWIMAPRDASAAPGERGELMVGGWGQGQVTVADSGRVDATTAYIGGFDADAISPSADWGLGTPTGTGTVNVATKGQVNTYQTVLGIAPESHGTLTVDGAESSYLVAQNTAYELSSGSKSGAAIVGGYGTGTATVKNGGLLTADRAVYVGGYAADELPFTGSGGAPLDPAANGTGTLTVQGEGSRVTTPVLAVGATGTGYLHVQDGASVTTSSQAGIGAAPGSHGEAVVGSATGAAASWANAASMFVGGYGTGSLSIQTGGHVDAGEALYIGGYAPAVMTSAALNYGNSPNGTGTVTVAGPGSALDVPQLEVFNLGVGMQGTGTLQIQSGGRVDSQVGVVGALTGGTGTVTVDGPYSLWKLSGETPLLEGFESAAQGSGTVTVANGGTIQVDGSKAILSVANDLAVGSTGQGTLWVAHGGSVLSGSAAIGGTANQGGHDIATGTVTMTGASSQWQVAQDLYVGLSGTGILDVADGQVADRAGWVAFQPDVTGRATFNGATARWTNQETLTVGASGTGTLNVENGAHVSAAEASLGGMPLGFLGEPSNPDPPAPGTGTAHVTGPGSTLAVTGPAYLGYSGAGTLQVDTGGAATTGVTLLGVRPGVTGTATVLGKDPTGVASTLSSTDTMVVGAWGTGRLSVSEAGQVTANNLYIGGFDKDKVGVDSALVTELGTPQGTGSVTVTGNGSTLNASGGETFVVGAGGTGTLTIADQGVVASKNSFVAYVENSTGTVSVTGTDSKWNVGGNLFVGGTAEAAGGTGRLTVGEGSLVDVTGEMTVWQTGALDGNGTVTVRAPTTLHNYGTISPGTSTAIGTLTVNGNMVFEPGSTYAVKINKTGSDKLEVNGDATINGGTVKVSSLETLVGAHDYQIVHAQSVTLPAGGTGFSELNTALLTFTVNNPSLSYDPTSVMLHIAATDFDDPTIAQTPNQQQLGGALQEIADGGGNSVTNALQQLEAPGDLRHAYDQLSGQSRPPLAPVAIMGTSRFLGTVTDRVQGLETGLVDGMFNSGSFARNGLDGRIDGGPMCNVSAGGQSIAIGHGSPILSDSQWGLWGRGYGLFGDRKTEDGVTGYSYNIYGGSVGLDYQFSERFLAGLVLGTADGKVDFANSRDTADFRALHIGLYDSLTWNQWYLDSMATYADLSYDTERFVDLTSERLRGDLNGYELAAYVEGGYNWNLSRNLLLQPLASLQYTYVHLDSYTETGGPSALSYDDQTHESVKGSLGARLTQQLFESASGLRTGVQLRGRWAHEFGDNQARVDTSFASNPGAVFTIHDAAIARDSALLGAGLSTDITRRLRAYVDYDARLNSDETVHVIGAALQYRW